MTQGDLKSLKMEGLEERQDLQRLVDLYQDFQKYVEQIAQYLKYLRGQTPSHELAATHEALRLRLRDEEHRFLEWHNGEQLLNPAVFGLVESLESYVADRTAFQPTLFLATQKFEYLIRKQERSLRELHEKIAFMTSEEEAHTITKMEPESKSVATKVKSADEIAEIGLKWGGRILKFMPWAEGILRTIGLR